MSLFEQTSGTIVNVLTVLVGSGLGLLLRGRLPQKIVNVVMQAIGLTTLLIGILNAMDLTRVETPPGIIVGLIALALGWRARGVVGARGSLRGRRRTPQSALSRTRALY